MNLREQLNKKLSINLVNINKTNRCQFVVDKIHRRYKDKNKIWKNQYFNRVCFQNLKIVSLKKINDWLYFIDCVCANEHLVKWKLSFNKRWHLINLSN